MLPENASGAQSSDSNQGPNHPGDGKTEFVPPKDGSWVPRERLNDVVDKLDRLQTQVDEEKTKRESAEAQAKEVSRETLLESVDAGEMTQAEADNLWEEQIATNVTKRIAGDIKTATTEKNHRDGVKAYEDAVPALCDKNSEVFERVTKEYDHMADELGFARDNATMCAALRAVLGPVKSLKNSVPESSLETYQETAGGGGGSRPQGDVPAGLTAREKTHYENAIRTGGYKDWNDVAETLKFSRARGAA